MAATDPQGQMQFWDNGFPFGGVKLGSNNAGQMQFWDSGFPYTFQFPDSGILSINVFDGISVSELPAPDNTNLVAVDAGGLTGTNAGRKRAQSFTANLSGTLANVRIKLQKLALPTDNALLSLYTDNAGEPGISLGQSNIAYNLALLNDLDKTLESDYTAVNFTFSSGPNIAAGTRYWILVERSGAYDDVNYFDVAGSTVTAFGSESSLVLNSSNAWQASALLSWNFVEFVTTIQEVFINTSVFDGITITESVSLSTSLDINVVDNITITEDISVSISSPVTDMDVNVSDSITITEDISISISGHDINVTDNITITEDITISNPLTGISIVDSITILEGPSYDVITEGPTAPNTAATQAGSGSNIVGWVNPNNAKLDDGSYTTASGSFSEDPIVSDSNILKLTNFGFSLPLVGTVVTGIKVSIKKKSSHDSGGNFVVDYKITLNKADDTAGSSNKADTVTHWSTSDVTTDYGGTNDSWSETLTGADINNSNFGVRIEASTHDNSTVVTASIDFVEITVYYYVQGYPKLEVESFVNIFDGITITENVTLSRESFISTVDSITITENTTLRLDSFINVSDSIIISEDISVSVGGTSDFEVSVIDSITITESVTITNETGFTSVFDSITITENIATTLPGGNIDIFDGVTITESINMLTESFVSVIDSIILTESLTLNNDITPINTFDSITITESTTLLLLSFIDVIDSITISENLSVVIQGSDGSLFDQITISEDVSVSIPTESIDVSDSITISEDAQVEIAINTLLEVSVSDLITLSESSVGVVPISLSVIDSIIISENIVFFSESYISIFDEITITENLGSENSLYINIYDSILITENLTPARLLVLEVSDSILISESVTISNPLADISVVDSLVISENINTDVISYVSVFDSITTSEYVLAESFRFSPSTGNPVAKNTVFEPVGRGSKIQSIGEGRSLNSVGNKGRFKY